MSDKDSEARKLAEAHYAIEPGIIQIFRVTGSADVEERSDEPIKLLEVNEFTVPSGVMPLQFGPAPAIGITYPSTIIEVTPAEFQKIQTQELSLPDGWSLGDLLPKPAGSLSG